MDEKIVDRCIGQLVEYGIQKGLISEYDRRYAVNQLLLTLRKDSFEEVPFDGVPEKIEDILEPLLDYAAENGLLKSEGVAGRDLFDTQLMGVLTPRPSEVIRTFQEKYQDSPSEATDYFYQVSRDSNYIRTTRVARDIRWQVDSPYGPIDLSINLSKPEKDPRDIAAARSKKQESYPKGQLCRENEGYAGRLDHPARENLRIIPVTLGGEEWGFQYSPYVYYNEHCIVLNSKHTPMHIDRSTFRRLFDFVRMFPDYFLGSNADLPIVGGSILTHDHFQGGRYEFAMAKAPLESTFTVPGYEDVECGIVKWPLSVIRLRCADEDRLVDLADHIQKSWRAYTDEEANIFAETEGVPHNTVTPIARRRGELFELDLALRNNLTTEKFPLGVYHPHPEYHHIKKENIGLIEVMGLAILPARLKTELDLLGKCLVSGEDIHAHEELRKHEDWAHDILAIHPELNAENVNDILLQETGKVFVKVLECAGVYPCTEEGRKAFSRFLAIL